MANIVVHPAAESEFRAAVSWYLEQSPPAATLFVKEVDRILAMIANQPDRFEWYDDQFRQALLTRFPYIIVYRVNSSTDVLIVAIAHAKREPGYWHDRT